jgi:hypothetical protein
MRAATPVTDLEQAVLPAAGSERAAKPAVGLEGPTPSAAGSEQAVQSAVGNVQQSCQGQVGCEGRWKWHSENQWTGVCLTHSQIIPPETT